MPLISVEHPITYTTWDHGKFTTYDIRVDCSEDSCPLFVLQSSSVPRRYSQFRWLKKRLSKFCPYTDVPDLPTAGCFLSDRFTKEFIENRRKGLEEFIKRIYSFPTLLSEASFHLFVQTTLSTEEIDGYLKRKWGRSKEVSQIVCELNKQKFDEEQDDLCSIASCSRWSDASAVSDFDDDDPDSALDDRPGSSNDFFVASSFPRQVSAPLGVVPFSQRSATAVDEASTSSGVASGAADLAAVRTRRRRRRRYCSNALRIAGTSATGLTPDFGRSVPVGVGRVITRISSAAEVTNSN